MSSKLFRSAPEHVRPVTSEEAKGILVRLNEPSISEIAQQLPSEVSRAVTRDVDMGMPNNLQIPSSQETITPPEETNHRPSSNNEGQPDNEPEIPSSLSTEPENAINEESQIPEDPKDIPVPIGDDDDLICEGLCRVDACVNVLEEVSELAWRAEILVTDADIKEWKQSECPGGMVFLASAAKRQRSEVKLSELNADEKAEFAKAKENEVSNWLKTGTVQKIFRNQIPPEQVLRCRFILTWKPLEESDRDPSKPQKVSKAKARLVVLGYLDPQITEIPRDSPTLNRHSKMLLLQLIASMSWDLRSFGIKAAFLQGNLRVIEF